MAVYPELVASLARDVADGQHPPGSPFPAVRVVARRHGSSHATAMRAFRELAAAGVIVTTERRVARVAPDGALAARRLLGGAAPFRLAGEDDPAVAIMADAAGGTLSCRGALGSFGGLAALAAGDADGALVALWHLSGAENEPYRALAGDDASCLPLLERQLGLVSAPGRDVRRIGDLAGLRVARQPVGAGARAVLDRLTRAARIELDAADPEVARLLDVGLAVASGSADAGVSVRPVAAVLGLSFAPLAWQAVAIVAGPAALPRLAPLLAALATVDVRERIEGLGGYRLAEDPAQ
jgi:putative molybdopterin biosynthesis protein